MDKFYKKGHLARRGKRWSALLMSVCLIGTMIPVTARAESGENKENILSEYNTSFEGGDDDGNINCWKDVSWEQTNISRKEYGEAAKPAADCGDYYVQAKPANIGGKAQCQIGGEGIAALIKGGKTYEYSYYAKLAEGEMAGTVTLSVIGDWTSSAVVTPDKEVTLNADEWQKVTGTFTLASDASQVVVVRFEETAGVAFCLDDLRVAEEPIPVTLSGITCDDRVYNGTAYVYTGTPVWMTEDGTPATGETSVTYQKAGEVLEKAPTDVGSYQAVFTITSDDYVGTESYSFEITKAEITVAAKNKSIYVGDAVPSLENPTAGTDYTVTGLCGTDALGGTVSMSYAEEPDNTKAGTYEILISGLTAPEEHNYTIAFTKGTLTITTKPSGGGSTGGSSDSGSSSGGSSGGAAGGAADKPADSGNTTTTTNKDGSTTTTTTETDANGNTVTTTTTVATDGSTTEKVQATDTNAAGKEVAVTTTTKTDADGNVTSVTEKSVIDNIAKDTTATVTKTSDTGTVSLGSKVLGQITEAAGADTEVRVTMTVKDSEGNTKYKVQADTNEIVPGEKLYIYKLDTKTGKYTMVNAKEYKVTKAGTVTVNMTKKATYELVTAQESKAITKEILATVKPAKSSTSLSEDKKTTFKLSAKLDMDNVKSITYATSKKSIATVSKKGTITAVNAGTATIKAVVTLKNGTKKTIKMTIKVK
ncbi:MAG: Ig-like domain-containing protein [Eubacterium sp.]|nr:Ig-like domain-containing protein [Eubacterium sp.]